MTVIAKRRGFGIFTGAPFYIGFFCYFHWHGLEIGFGMRTVTIGLVSASSTGAPEV